ncbi:glutamategamma-aminobutyrate antiporter [Limosilactobacillus coleohominis DSM 14060]|nr:glutamategamma-aminobutyrate antiporter [Limosilactobacillus coleohominis DSM 14060]
MAGPNQGLFVAARQGYMPKYFAKPNKRGVPMRIVVLQAIVVTITALMITFDSGENADFAFNVSMAATTAQYLMVYLMMIVAYIVLKNKYENLYRTYRMSNSRTFSIVVAVIGFVITLTAFFITFIPPRRHSCPSSFYLCDYSRNYGRNRWNFTIDHVPLSR